ncbi:MAG: hypothetical protein JO057_11255 [Chloroflexi bacterium]|nr:hypothetical protein [Chloroflexota bacterium]
MTFLKPLLVGRDPLDIGALWQTMHQRQRYVDPGAIGVVDVGLWDIAGKAAGMPIHPLLGSYRQTVPAYSPRATTRRQRATPRKRATGATRAGAATSCIRPHCSSGVAACQWRPISKPGRPCGRRWAPTSR